MAKNQMTRLDRFPSAINNKFHHFYEAIKIQAGYFIIIIFCLGWRRLEGAGTQDVLGNLWRSLLSCARATA